MNYVITIEDPCITQPTTIDWQGGTGGNFDLINKYNLVDPIISTSVKYGSDTNPSGLAATFTFPIHSDSVSTTYPITERTYACGDR